jgi:alkylhydroperoxidase/carboxymuconolactone decarboxylase family protein YurZ
MHVHERNREKRRLSGLITKSPMRVLAAFGELGKQVYADGAVSKKHKELTALAIAVSQNCFD